MFSPPGTKIFASRLLHRKRHKMQQTAMKEAIAAGWQQYNSDDDDDDDVHDDEYYNSGDDDRSAVMDLLRVDDTDTTEVSNSLSTDGHIDMKVYSKKNKTKRTVPNPVSFDIGNEEDNNYYDEDDSSVESDDEDTALANQDLHTLLEALKQQPQEQPLSNSPFMLGTGRNYSYISDSPVNTVNDRVSPVLSPNSISSIDETNEKTKKVDYNDNDSDDDDTISDTDSLDLGVPTSIWPSQKENNQQSFFTNATSSNASAKRMIAEIGTLSTVFSPREKHTMTAPLPNDAGSASNEDDDVYENDDEVDEPHVGSEVFLFTEGTRYSGQDARSKGASNVIKNNLLHIQDAASISFSAESKIESVYEDEDDIDNTFIDTKRSDLRLVIDHDDNKQPLNSKGGDNCFGSIQLVSPKFFITEEMVSGTVPTEIQATTDAPVMSPLSSMVHPMNLSLFDFNDVDESINKQREKKKMAATSNERNNVVDRIPSSILTSIEQDYAFSDNDVNNRRSNLSTSFKSSTTSNRIAYHIKSDRKHSMTKSDRSISKSFLPKEQILNPNSTKASSGSMRSSSNHSKNTNRGSLAVLLADIQSKIFEVVAIDVQQDTSVGDVLSKARTSATDPGLSEQKYISFCYGTQEFGAPMLPIHLVIDWDKHKTRPLVVAVPVGSTAYEMQSVKRVLWKNPKLREWWKQEDPFVPKPRKEKPPIPPMVETTSAATKNITTNAEIQATSTKGRTVKKVVETPTVAAESTAVVGVVPTSVRRPSLAESLKVYERVEV